ncbi:unnamed protein product [Protopolystoma xenopodis]|uniref:Uncharacterized protein n=1 Tax=Protopolystoma xenopodis TaxID=117903 RepID=A0A3S5AIN1_9PLAT|nr:unnamed protein product [Protopolystoma xenopodis]
MTDRIHRLSNGAARVGTDIIHDATTPVYSGRDKIIQKNAVFFNHLMARRSYQAGVTLQTPGSLVDTKSPQRIRVERDVLC